MTSIDIRKLGLVLIAVILLLAIVDTVSAATLSAPQFGAYSQNISGIVDGDPIGGGTGYSDIITEGDYTATTAAELYNSLNASAGTLTRKVIYIPQTANINVSGIFNMTVPANVTIASNRGYAGSNGGRIFRIRLPTDPVYVPGRYDELLSFRVAGNNVRITGLRIQGDDMTQTGSTGGDFDRMAIAITHESVRNLTVDNNELYGWTLAAVFSDVWHSVSTDGFTTSEIGKDIIYAHHNYCHHDQKNGAGYCFASYRNSTILAKGNLFDYTRHAVESDGFALSGYEASYNIHLGHQTDHTFDVHRTNFLETWADTLYGGDYFAGYNFSTHHNTVYGNTLAPTGKSTPWSVGVRSIPIVKYYVYANDFKSNTTYGGVAQVANNDPSVVQYDWDGIGNVSLANNLQTGSFNQTGAIRICHETYLGDHTCGY